MGAMISAASNRLVGPSVLRTSMIGELRELAKLADAASALRILTSGSRKREKRVALQHNVYKGAIACPGKTRVRVPL